MTPPLGTRGLLSEQFGYGRGWEEIVPGTQPAAGANFTYRIDGQYSTRLLSLLFTLATDANAADRAVTIDYCNPDGTPWVSNGYGAVITANTTQKHSAQIDRTQGEWASGTTIFFPITDVFVDAGNSIRINVANKQAGDQISGIIMVLERFPTGKRGYPEGQHVTRTRR